MVSTCVRSTCPSSYRSSRSTSSARPKAREERSRRTTRRLKANEPNEHESSVAPRRPLGVHGGGGGMSSVLVVGLSHRRAPVALLERTAVAADELVTLMQDV